MVWQHMLYRLVLLALPFLRRKEGCKVLIGDNLSTHFSQDVIDECQQYNIHFLCLPPNSIHLCQPPDVSLLRPLKIQQQSILNEWKSGGGRRSATVSNDKFPQLLKQLLFTIGAASSNASWCQSMSLPIKCTSMLTSTICTCLIVQFLWCILTMIAGGWSLDNGMCWWWLVENRIGWQGWWQNCTSSRTESEWYQKSRIILRSLCTIAAFFVWPTLRTS